MKKRIIIAFWAVISLMILTTVASASYMTFTNEADFLNKLAPGYYLEDFTGVVWGQYNTEKSHTWSKNDFSYSMFAANKLSGIPNAMSTWEDYDPLIITMTGKTVHAIGGQFFLNDNDGRDLLGKVTVNLPSFGISQELNYVTSRPFFGVISTEAITSLNVVYDGVSGHYAGVDHLYVGSAVPLPGAVLLLGAGMARLIAYARRRQD